MNESSILIILILGVATGFAVNLVKSHQLHWWHSLLVWSIVAAVLVYTLLGKPLRYEGPHLGFSPGVVKELIVPNGLPALLAILVGAVIGWWVARHDK